MKKLSLLLTAALLALALAGCSNAAAPAETAVQAETAAEAQAADSETESQELAASQTTDTLIRIGGLKGPTTMGLVKLMDQSAKGEALNNYEFTMVTAADELTALIAGGRVDIALLPANLSAVLYQKTQQNISVIDINTLGVLYLVSADASLEENSLESLKGKTVYLPGKGTTPEYALRHLMNKAGLSDSDVTLEFKSEATEVASILAEEPEAIGLLPQPFATVAMMQNDKLSLVADLSTIWDSVSSDSQLVTGVTIVSNDFLAEHEDLVKTFLTEHEASIQFAIDNPKTASELIVDAGIVAKAPIALKALDSCHIAYLEGAEMKEALSGYLNTLFEQNPASVGGALPDDAFYYMP